MMHINYINMIQPSARQRKPAINIDTVIALMSNKIQATRKKLPLKYRQNVNARHAHAISMTYWSHSRKFSTDPWNDFRFCFLSPLLCFVHFHFRFYRRPLIEMNIKNNVLSKRSQQKVVCESRDQLDQTSPLIMPNLLIYRIAQFVCVFVCGDCNDSYRRPRLRFELLTRNQSMETAHVIRYIMRRNDDRDDLL